METLVELLHDDSEGYSVNQGIAVHHSSHICINAQDRETNDILLQYNYFKSFIKVEDLINC